MNRRKILLAITSFFGVNLKAQKKVAIVRRFHDWLINARPDAIATTLVLRGIVVAVSVPLRGTNALERSVVVVYDQRTKRFWWTLKNDGGDTVSQFSAADWYRSHALFFESDDAILGFFVFSKSLMIRECISLSAATIDDAQIQIADYIEANVDALGEVRVPNHEVPLTDVPYDFFYSGNEAIIPSQFLNRAKVTRLERTSVGWSVIAECDWSVEILLSSDFKLLSIHRLRA